MKFNALISCLLLWLLSFSAFGQRAEKLRELEGWLKHAKKDSVYIDKLNYLSNEYALSGEKDALPLARKALRMADSLHYERGQGLAHMNIAIIQDIRGQYHEALENYLISMKLLRKVNDEFYLAHLLQNLGLFYSTQGNYRKAIEVTKQAADLTLKNSGELSTSYNWSNLGHYYTQASEYDSALYFTLRAYEVQKAEKDTAGLADIFFNLANIAWKADENAFKALNYGLQALSFYEVRQFEVETYIDCKSFVGYMYLQLENYPMAEFYLQEALQEAEKHQLRFLMKNIYRWQSELFATLGAWEKAYQQHHSFFQLHDSIFSEHSTNRVEQLKAEFELESREAKIELLNKNRLIQADELERQMIYRNSFLGLFALFLLVAAVLYKSNTAKNRANRILLEQKQQIEEKNAAILRQNQLLEEQKQAILSQANNLNQAKHQISRQRQAIERKTQDLTSNLDYASRIQQAMMPQPEDLKGALPDSFIWLNPKEVVSGDFYWFAQAYNKIYLAAIDCTGHGVPGAFMSLVGDVYLNQIILQEEMREANQILARLHEHVRRTLHQEVGYTQDGMEVSLCVIDLTRGELQFAGARSNLYLCQQGAVKKISGDRMYIGGPVQPDDKGFTAHTISFKEATSFYLCTDGIRDQFGGDHDKKFGEKRLLELISSMYHLPMEEQKAQLCKTMRAWMQGYEQIDDMMVIGWKL